MKPYSNHLRERNEMNFTLKNIPDDIYEKIKVRAERNHRSINGEIIAILGETVMARRRSAAEILARAWELRSHTRGFLTDEFLNKVKREGLP
jgi:plasmid stability protein